MVIATGSRPLVPMAWREIFGDKVLTTDSLFELSDLPASVAVVGLGTIGLELGRACTGSGSPSPGSTSSGTSAAQDPEVQRCAFDILDKEFPIHLGEPVSLAEEGEKLRVTAGDQGLLVDRVLCSVGRVPNVESLGLDKLGVPLDRRGIPVYNPSTMQVGDLPVFIAGDVSGDRPVLHEAGDEGRIAGYNAAHGEAVAFRRKVPLYINFCDPNICAVGARWNDLDQAATAVGQINFAPVGRALIMGKNKGVLRVYGDKQTGRILGAEMVGPKGENLAHLLAWCIEQCLTVGRLLRMPFYHPVIEEALQAALYDLHAKVEAKNQGGLVELERLAG